MSKAQIKAKLEATMGRPIPDFRVTRAITDLQPPWRPLPAWEANLLVGSVYGYRIWVKDP